MNLGVMTKAPDDVLDYDIDYSLWLPPQDRIASVDAALQDASPNCTISIRQSQYADRSAKIWLAGGAAGDTATVAVTINTNAGRTKEACFRIRVRECS